MDLFLGVFFIVLSLVVYILMLDFPPGTVAEGMGPAFMPGFLIFILVVLSLILFFDALFRRKKGVKPPGAVSSIFGPNLKVPGVLIIVVSMYLLSLDLLGFLLATPIFILLTMKVMGERLKSGILTGICLTGLVYVVFALALRVPLPAGHILELIGG